MTSRDPESQGRDLICMVLNIWKTSGDTDSVTMEHLLEVAPGVPNGHVPDGVT